MIKNSYGFYISNIYIKKYKLYKFKKFVLTKYTNMIEFSLRKKIKTFTKNIFSKNQKTNIRIIKKGLWIIDEKAFITSIGSVILSQSLFKQKSK